MASKEDIDRRAQDEASKEAAELRERLDGFAPKLAAAERIAIEADRHVQAINAERSRYAADLTEARAELRTATREHDETTAALRAQVAALQGVIDGHEQAIKDACADVRAEYEDERATDRARRTRLVDTIAALETTVDVLAGRLAARGS